MLFTISAEEACPSIGEDMTVTELIDDAFPKTIQCAFGANTTSSCINATWTEQLDCCK